MARRCFISAPGSANVAPLLGALRSRQWEPFVLSDVAELGASLTESLQGAINTADVVIGIFPEEALGSANTAFEMGVAAALHKPVLLLVGPDADLPSDLSSYLYVRSALENDEALALALDNIERYAGLTREEGAAISSAAPLGAYADELLERANMLGEAPTREVEQLLTEALQAGGAVAVAGSAGDAGFDIGVWSDDLDAIDGNPLLVELKHKVDEQSLTASLQTLQRTPRARAALVVSLSQVPPVGVGALGWPVLWISLGDLLRRMRGETFPEVIRDLRNRSVHGRPG
jgi:hypothetical protein